MLDSPNEDLFSKSPVSNLSVKWSVKWSTSVLTASSINRPTSLRLYVLKGYHQAKDIMKTKEM